MNKTELIQKVKDIEGLSQDEKAYLINLVNTKKKYGLVWEDKPEEVEEQLRDNLPVLKEVKEKAILYSPPSGEPVEADAPNHILIEGDNLHALTTLTFTHEGKIDVIYIDPPYNTGSNDFRYNDNYVDKEDNFRHSKWLSFMYKRLKSAKNILKRNGVIFISINEEEFSQLKLLCDEIFGISNYLTSFTIKVRHENRILKGDKDFHEVTEYLLMYRKSIDFRTVKRIKDNTSLDLYTYRVVELEENPEKIILDGKEVCIFKPGQYEIKRTEPSEESLKCISIRGSIKEGNSSGRFFMKHLAKRIGKEFGVLYRVPDMGDDESPFRYFKLPDNSKRVNGDYFQGVPINRSNIKEVPFPNFFDFVDEFNNVGYEGNVEFRNGKKPIRFLHKIFEIAGFSDGVILDFFAGSGSTLHAILELNAEDGGNRQCILVTNNENNIAEEICYERNKRVIQGYTNSKGAKEEGLNHNNLRYYKTEFVSRNTSIKNHYCPSKIIQL
ncbi:MAG: site-specific DNA-methyltransferase [Chitinophagaceae bacterium]|nr:MAG: site-specific DNA-methyltransferase [Chitinophagaceae bacterium]